MSHPLIDYYRAIEDSSRQMLEAARSADWDGVVRIEGVCAVLIGQLRDQATREQLDAGARAEKSRIMLRILHNDAEIRNLVEPRLESAFSHIHSPRQTYLH